MRADLNKNVHAVGYNVLCRLLEKHGLADIVPPVFGVQFPTIEQFSGDGGIKRMRDFGVGFLPVPP